MDLNISSGLAGAAYHSNPYRARNVGNSGFLNQVNQRNQEMQRQRQMEMLRKQRMLNQQAYEANRRGLAGSRPDILSQQLQYNAERDRRMAPFVALSN